MSCSACAAETDSASWSTLPCERSIVSSCAERSLTSAASVSDCAVTDWLRAVTRVSMASVAATALIEMSSSIERAAVWICSSAWRTCVSMRSAVSATSRVMLAVAATMRLEMVSSMRSAPASRSAIDWTSAVLIAVLSEARRSAVMSARAVIASGRVPSRWSTMSVIALRAELTPVSMMSAALRALSPTVDAAPSIRAVTPVSASAMRRIAVSMPRPRLSLTSATLLAMSVDTAVARSAMMSVTERRLASILSRASVPWASIVRASSIVRSPMARAMAAVWVPSTSPSCCVRVLSASESSEERVPTVEASCSVCSSSVAVEGVHADCRGSGSVSRSGCRTPC